MQVLLLNSNYQDNVTTSLTQEYDNDTTAADDDTDEAAAAEDLDTDLVCCPWLKR